MERVNLSEMQPAGAAAAGIGIGAMIFFAVIVILIIASMWKVYTKAGQPGWAAIVPIYNIVVLLQIVRKPLWWIVLFFIPVVNFVVFIILWVELAKVFGKSSGFAIGLIFLGVIFFPILAFGDAKYIGASSSAPPAPSSAPGSPANSSPGPPSNASSASSSW